MQRRPGPASASGPLSAPVTVPVPVITRRALVGYGCFLLAVALVFGGGTRQGTPGDAIVEILGLPLLGYGLLTLRFGDLPKPARIAVVLAAAIAALPILQLVPLPPAIWSRLPGRAQFASTYISLDMSVPWLPVSLDPAATWWSLLSLIPGLSLFLITLRFAVTEKRALVKCAVLVGLFSVLLDGLQTIGGDASPLRFHTVTNVDRAVGFFANSNHNATFLAGLIPFLIGMLASGDNLFGSKRVARSTGAIVFAAVFVGLALAQSRAGLALGFLGAALSLVSVYSVSSTELRAKAMRYGLVALVAASLLAFQFGFLALSQRLENQDLIQDLRWPVAAVTFEAATGFIPVGSGLGTFQPVYEMSAPRTLVRPAYVNHAHDDWLELWLEGGVPAAILAGAFLVLYAALAFAVFRRTRSASDAGALRLARAAAISILLVLLHSLLDYPLRTTAVMSVFGVYVSILASASARNGDLRGDGAT
jgi:O-antigen ligase